MARLDFDATTVDPQQPFDPVPAGKYPMVITESEMKLTKNGAGQYLQLTCQIVEGEYAGRKVWDRLNLDNPNAQAVEIAQRQLSAICHAVGILKPKDSEELHDKMFLGKVKFVKGEGQYADKNEMAGYEAMTGTVQSAQPAQAARPAQAAAPAASSASPPWKRTAT